MLHRLGFPSVGRHRRFVTAIAIDAVGSGVFMPISMLYFLVATDLTLVQVGAAISLASLVALPTGPLIGLQFRKRGDHMRPAVDEVTQHSQLRALGGDGRDHRLCLVDASGRREAGTQQSTRPQQRLRPVLCGEPIDPFLRPPAGKLLVRGIGFGD